MPKSKIAALPEEIRDAVNELIRDGRATIDEIVAKLRELGIEDVSRSSVGRFKKNAEEKMARHRESQQIADIWIAKFGNEPSSDVARLVAQFLKTAAATAAAGLPDNAEPSDIMLLAKALKDITSADKTMVDREQKIRALLREEVAQKVATAGETVSAVAKAGALSADAEAKIREALTGIKL